MALCLIVQRRTAWRRFPSLTVYLLHILCRTSICSSVMPFPMFLHWFLCLLHFSSFSRPFYFYCDICGILPFLRFYICALAVSISDFDFFFKLLQTVWCWAVTASLEVKVGLMMCISRLSLQWLLSWCSSESSADGTVNISARSHIPTPTPFARVLESLK